MCQIWVQVAAEYYRIRNVKCYSGGTETTAFNPRAVRAVQTTGFTIDKMDESDNPLCLVYYSDGKEPIKYFSKTYSNSFNPKTNFAAIVTFSDADKNCPVVLGAEARFPIQYNDPKDYERTELEEKKYYERFEHNELELLFFMWVFLSYILISQ